MILPFFVPHLGCGSRCSYCNQDLITSVEDAHNLPLRIEKLLRPTKNKVEVALYGGNILGLNAAQLDKLFGFFAPHTENIQSFRISAKPGRVPDDTLEVLHRHNVRVIELGIPCFNDETLRILKRGHTVRDFDETYGALLEAGFIVGIQVMVGLPGESRNDIRTTVSSITRIRPAFQRIYPLLVLAHTDLATDCNSSRFIPLALEEAVKRCAFIYVSGIEQRVRTIKMGLTENDVLVEAILAGPYHPAFGYLVKAHVFLLAVSEVCKRSGAAGEVCVKLNRRDIPHLTGHKGENVRDLGRRGIAVTWEGADIEENSFVLTAGGQTVKGSVLDALPTILS